MHTMYANDIVRQAAERTQARAERTGMHVAALMAGCRRARGLRGLLGGCARV
jgi:hypothetical protein